MPLFDLDRDTLDAPLTGHANLQNGSGLATLREALGTAPTLVAFVRHLG